MSTEVIPSYLKTLGLPGIARSYEKLAAQARRDQCGYEEFLQSLLQEELQNRKVSRVRTLLKSARFPLLKQLDTFEFDEIPSLNRQVVKELARNHYIPAKENVLICGNSGTGKTHVATALGISACEAGYRVRFTTTQALANELLAAREEHSLNRYEKQWSRIDLAIIDELGYLPFDATTAQLLFQFISARYELGSIMITTNLEFAQWTEVFGDERMTIALLDRLTHRAHILLMNGESYRFKNNRRASQGGDAPSA